MLKVVVRKNAREFIRRGFDPSGAEATISVLVSGLDAEERELLAGAISGGPDVFAVRSRLTDELLTVDEPTRDGLIAAVRRDSELNAAVDHLAAEIDRAPWLVRALAERFNLPAALEAWQS